MLRLCKFVAAALFITLAAAGQDGGPKPVVSKDLLTADQIAIYRVVLAAYVRQDPGSNAALNIASRTEPFHTTGLWAGSKECIHGLKLELPPQPPVVHRLGREISLGPKMVLVDPERQAELVKKNDPAHLVDRAVVGHEPVTDQQVDDSVKQAFTAALFTFSEIVFDKQHKFAVVTYDFWCGSLCGNGEMLILQKSAGKWHIKRHCGEWVS